MEATPEQLQGLKDHFEERQELVKIIKLKHEKKIIIDPKKIKNEEVIKWKGL